MKTFDITFKNVEYTIDVIEDGEEVEVFVERNDTDEEIPDNELLAVIEYLVKEGFVPNPAQE